MNVATLVPQSRQPAIAEWWNDPKMVSLVRRTAAGDCNTDEFDEFVAVCRDLRLSPLRKQIYAFVFNKDNDRRNMVIVVGIDGARAVAARTGCFRPDNRAPRFTYDESLKDENSNPLGLVSAEVSSFIFSNGGWHEIVGVAYWDEFAPLQKVGDGDDAYELVPTGGTWADSGKPKMRKKLKPGETLTLRLDPKKEGWRKSARHMLAKCAEMIGLRKGFPEDLSRVYAEEETHRSQVIDAEYTVLSPSEMAAKGEADARLERLGGPALFATFVPDGTIERIPIGQFADRMLEATDGRPPEAVAVLIERNREAINEFWAHNKTDALALKRELEKRASNAG